MDLMKIIAYFNGEKIGHCTHTKLIEKSSESARYLIFKDFQVENKFIIDNSGYSYINFTIYIINRFKETIELGKFKIIPLEEVVFNENRDVKVYGHIIPDYWTDNYEQNVIDIFHLWNTKTPIDRTNSNIDKEGFLRARGIFFGHPTELPTKRIIEIEGEKILDYTDFFLELADQLYGKRGYFGSGWDSLSDVLISFSKINSSKKSFHIKMKNIVVMENVMGRDTCYSLVNLLEEQGFDIEIS